MYDLLTFLYLHMVTHSPCMGDVTGGGRGNCSCGTGVLVRLAMSDWKRWVIRRWQVSVLENHANRHTRMNAWIDKEQVQRTTSKILLLKINGKVACIAVPHTLQYA